MQNILNVAKLEKRALTEDEITKFNELKKLITEIDATINVEEEAREMNIEEKKKENSEIEEKTEKVEERAFVDLIITGEERAASPGMSYGRNGAIVSTTIAKKIIEKVKKFSTKGTLEIPVYGSDNGVDSPTGDVNVAYQGDEFTALVAG